MTGEKGGWGEVDGLRNQSRGFHGMKGYSGEVGDLKVGRDMGLGTKTTQTRCV